MEREIEPVLTIDKLSYSNKMVCIHPLEKVLLSLVPLGGILFSGSFVLPVLVFFSMLFFIIVLAGISRHILSRLFLVPMVFICMSLIPFIFSIDIGGEKGAAYLSEDGIRKALFLLVKSLSSISCFYFLILSTPLEQIDYLMGKLKISSLFREILILLYRFIFLLIEMVNQIYVSQRQRAGYVNLKGSLKSVSLLSASVLSRSVRYCRQAHLAVMSRGGDSDFSFLGKDYCLSVRNLFFISMYFLLLILIFIGEVLWLI